MLQINHLSVQVETKLVLDQFSLTVEPASQHILVGPNGSGKSSLAFTIMGHPSYAITQGEIYFKNLNITNMAPHERAKLGIYLAFQYPTPINVRVLSFLKTIYEAKFAKSISFAEFKKLVQSYFEIVGLSTDFMEREVHFGFSGGERKRFEILQIFLLRPELLLIDEIDSGLDIDAIKSIAESLNYFRAENPDSTMILITHYQRIVNYLHPDQIHLLSGGKLVQSGDLRLLEQIEQSGYKQQNIR